MATTLLSLLVVGLALAGLHHLALWAERRGWIFYKHTKASPGTAGRAFMEVQSLLEPAVKHVIESKREEVEEQDNRGDPLDHTQRTRKVG